VIADFAEFRFGVRLWMASAPDALHQNRLSRETSPYLLQHQHNPVHWWPWGPDALAEAKRTNKPILLSVGYAACHWCHVMAHESFEDEATAAAMNELFVSIKVDREERPDIDQIYMNALHLLGEQGGWPLTMFLAPDGSPFWGGIYFPKTSQYGRVAFTDVLREVARIFRDEPNKIAQNRNSLVAKLAERARSDNPGNIGITELDRAATSIARATDPVNGCDSTIGCVILDEWPSPRLWIRPSPSESVNCCGLMGCAGWPPGSRSWQCSSQFTVICRSPRSTSDCTTPYRPKTSRRTWRRSIAR